MSPTSLAASLNHARLWHRPLRVWDFRLTPPSFDRWLYLAAHRAGLMGAGEKRFLEGMVRPGMQIADVGANLGLYTLLLARLAGPGGTVFSFEPSVGMAAALRANLAANPMPSVEVFPCAVGAAAGQGVLQEATFNSGNTALRKDASVPTADAMVVPIRSLDEALAGRRLDFVKMDVQGWEGEVWQGLDGLLEANPHLTVYFEFWPKGLAAARMPLAQLQGILRERGMRVTHPETGSDAAIDLEALAAGMKPGAYTNLLARRPS